MFRINVFWCHRRFAPPAIDKGLATSEFSLPPLPSRLRRNLKISADFRIFSASGLKTFGSPFRVTCPYSYFVSELLWAPLKDLERIRPWRLTVFSLGKMLDPPDPANSGPTSRGLTESSSASSEDAAEEIKAGLSARMASREAGDEAGGAAPESGSPYRPTPYVLDIDLDFYSTKNPFLREVGENVLEILKDLYYFKMPPCDTEEEIETVSRDRQLQLDGLLSKLRQTILDDDDDDDQVISHDSRRLSENVDEASESASSSTKRLTESCIEAATGSDASSSTSTSDLRLIKLRKAVDEFLAKERATLLSTNEGSLETGETAASSKEDDPADEDSISKFLRTKARSDLPEYLHEVGCTCDETPLPHHVSSQRQIDHLISETMTFLKTLPKPAVVTLARSSLDDYCPQDQVDDIQAKVLKMLEGLYGPLNVTLDY